MITFPRNILIPDKVKIERYRRVPELGPKILFFSGGNALKDLSSLLTNYTYNSIHLITAFDSGGSSAKLREAFNIIGIGDIRNRIMTLADQNVKGNPDIYKLFAYRLPNTSVISNIKSLENICKIDHALINPISEPMKTIIADHLSYFLNNMPEGFDLNGASIGNLILTGGFLNNNRQWDTVIYIFSKLVETKGIVRPITDKSLHLIAELEDGSILKGQHLLSSTGIYPANICIKRIFLSKEKDNPEPVDLYIADEIRKLISKAELICYPYGSFYSSVLANFLPLGVGECISLNNCPKIYIPNPGHDPEQYGLDLYGLVKSLLYYLRKGAAVSQNEKLLNFILVDKKTVDKQKDTVKKIENDFNIQVIPEDILLNKSQTIDPAKVVNVLLSLT